MQSQSQIYRFGTKVVEGGGQIKSGRLGARLDNGQRIDRSLVLSLVEFNILGVALQSWGDARIIT